MVDNGEIGIVGAMYDVTSGLVEFYEDTKIINHTKATEAIEA
jgi:carbonic anhydrase